MRFDLRSPGRDAPQRAALHRAALDMAAWADERGGCASVVVSEHHASDGGYLSSPILDPDVAWPYLRRAVAAVVEVAS